MQRQIEDYLRARGVRFFRGHHDDEYFYLVDFLSGAYRGRLNVHLEACEAEPGTVLVADAAHGAVLELGEDGRTRVIFNEFERVRLRVRLGGRSRRGVGEAAHCAPPCAGARASAPGARAAERRPRWTAPSGQRRPQGLTLGLVSVAAMPDTIGQTPTAGRASCFLSNTQLSLLQTPNSVAASMCTISP
jgi:hypothetical protein